MKRNNDVDKDTEKWVEEQNAFFERKREKQKGEVPARFDPKGPVKILDRKCYSSALISGQAPERLKDSKYTQRQPNYWMAGYEGAWYRKEFGAGYSPKDRKWPQENGYGREYGIGKKKRTDRSYKPKSTQSQVYYTMQKPGRNGRHLPTMGTKYDFEDEESDTEDFYELEITPQQLSQVVPGGGV